MENQILKIAGVQNYQTEWQKYYDNDKVFIIKYRSIYELKHNDKRGYFATELKDLKLGAGTLPYIGKGRYVAYNKKELTSLINN